MGIEYYAFDKVVKELGMDEDELKRLVSEGQIRAFRDENRMKFRKDDIDSLKKGKQTEPTIILPEGALDEGDGDDLVVVDADTEETILDLEGIGDSDFATDESSVPSLDFDDMGAGQETLTEELVFDEADDMGGTEELSEDYDDLGQEATQRIDSDAAFLDDDEFGMQTEPLGIEEDDADATFVDESPVEDEDFTQAGDEAEETVVSAPPPRKRGAAAPARKGKAAPKARPAPAPAMPAPAPLAARPVGVVWPILLLFVAIFYTLAALCMYDYSTNSSTGVSAGIGGWISKEFLKEEWQHPLYQPEKSVSVPAWLKQQAADATPEGGGEGGEGIGLEGGN